MSTQQVLGVVGGVVGAFFGYPQLGFVVGSLVGGLLSPAEKTQGPRVDDLKVQVSTYGAGIPILYGTERIGGNVVWSTDKIEMEETSGGKGGPPENTTYRYFVHMGIVLCDTPRDGSEVSIVQIFQDGKLIYDARSGIPLGSALASAENPHAFFVLYQGHADQLPDAIEELYMGGPGTVPAYRGVVRIRMNAVECPGGRVPQYSFVLSNRASLVKTVQTLVSLPATLFPGFTIETGIPSASGAWHMRFLRNINSLDQFECYRCIEGAATLSGKITRPAFTYISFPSPVVGSVAGVIFVRSVSPTVLEFDLLNLESATINLMASLESDTPIGIGLFGAAFDAQSETHVVLAADGVLTGKPVFLHSGQARVSSGAFVGECGPVAMHGGLVYAVLIKTISSLRYYYVDILDAATGSIVSSAALPMPATVATSVVPCMLRADDLGVFVFIADGSSPSRLYSLSDQSTFKLVSDDAGVLGLNATRPSAFYSSTETAVFGPAYKGPLEIPGYDFVKFRAVSMEDVKVVDIISDQCERADEVRFDLSSFPESDTLRGYKLQNPASARSNIDPLLTAYSGFIVDEDDLIKFKKYKDITSAALIKYEELGQTDEGGAAEDAMPLSRAQELDLPRSVSVSYIEPTKDYQTATEKEARQITEANEDVIVELPIATDSDHAKQVAQTMLFNRWRAQNTRSFKTSRAYAYLSPGDGVTVEYPKGTFRLWRITSNTDTGVLCEFNVEPGDAELYTQMAVGATGYVAQQVEPLPPDTRLQILDIPILRDQDNNAGLYAAMTGFGPGWSGAELFIGDDASTMDSRGTVQNSAVIGVCESALGSWGRGEVDETNLLVVNVASLTLSSIAYEVFISGDQNVAAVGAPGRWEIIKFRAATSLGGGRYTLSGLMRGRRGTEWARASHQPGDRFVLLTLAGMLRPNLDAGSIGQTKFFKAVSKGRGFSSASVQPYANTAEGLETFSPTNLTKTFSSAGLIFDWVRRTRLTENWLAGIVPLGEAQEKYELVMYTDSTFLTVKRILTANSRTVTYTNAMQTEDGYSSGPLYVRVYQISDTVGRGHPLQTSI